MLGMLGGVSVSTSRGQTGGAGGAEESQVSSRFSAEFLLPHHPESEKQRWS